MNYTHIGAYCVRKRVACRGRTLLALRDHERGQPGVRGVFEVVEQLVLVVGVNRRHEALVNELQVAHRTRPELRENRVSLPQGP
jgi:uncharacterized protein (DUF2461 family)